MTDKKDEETKTLVTQAINAGNKIIEPWDTFKKNLKDPDKILSKHDERKIRYYIYFVIISASISIYLLIGVYGTIAGYTINDLLVTNVTGLLTVLFIFSYVLNSIKIYGAYKCLSSMKGCGPCCGCICAYFCSLYVSPCVICNDVRYNTLSSDIDNINRESLIVFANNEEYIAAITAIAGIGDAINHLIGCFTGIEVITAIRIISVIWSLIMAIYGFYVLKQTKQKIGIKAVLCSPIYVCCPDRNKQKYYDDETPLNSAQHTPTQNPNNNPQ